MTLKDLLADGRVRPHRTSAKEVADLLRVVGRDLALDNCRSKRNVTDYDRAGEISQREAEEILAEVRAFRGDLLDWLKRNHPTLWPKGAAATPS